MNMTSSVFLAFCSLLTIPSELHNTVKKLITYTDISVQLVTLIGISWTAICDKNHTTVHTKEQLLHTILWGQCPHKIQPVRASAPTTPMVPTPMYGD